LNKGGLLLDDGFPVSNEWGMIENYQWQPTTVVRG
jgi:hypothetical protein